MWISTFKCVAYNFLNILKKVYLSNLVCQKYENQLIKQVTFSILRV